MHVFILLGVVIVLHLFEGDSPSHSFPVSAEDEENLGYAEKSTKGQIPGIEADEDISALASPRFGT